MKTEKLATFALAATLVISGCSGETEKNETAESLPTADGEVTENYMITEIDPNKPVIALTFDDGPNLTTTNEVIEMLEKYKIVASFFVIGNNINDETAEVMRKAHSIGCEINSHSLTHPYMTELTGEEIKAEMDTTAERIFNAVGEYPRFFRPPYIAVCDTMWENIDLPFICGVSANDWDSKVTADIRSRKILAQAEDGVIILLHDMEGNAKTVEALDTIIPTLLDEGYQFVTVSQLFDAKGIEPASQIIYTNVMQTGMYS